MSETLSAFMSKGKPTMDSLWDFLSVHGAKGSLSNTALKRFTASFLARLNGAIPPAPELVKLSQILLCIARNPEMVDQLAQYSRALSSALDMILAFALQSTDIIAAQTMIITVFDMINSSDKLKSQLGMSIHEYVLSNIEKDTLDPRLLSKVLELLVSAVTHHPENRTFFIKNTSKERLAKVFGIMHKTGNPMAEIFATEFLWRIAIPMRLSADDKQSIFGDLADPLYSITTNAFRDGILTFVRLVNEKRTDDYRVAEHCIHDLVIGNIPASGEHTVYIGDDTILLWVKKSEFAEAKPDVELISLNKSEVRGITKVGSKWVIGILENFDTLPTFFDDTSKMIVFQLRNESREDIMLAQNRFGMIDVDRLPEPRQTTRNRRSREPPHTPQPKRKTQDVDQTPRSMTPKTSVKHSERPKKLRKLEQPPTPPRTPTVVRQPPKKQVLGKLDDDESDYRSHIYVPSDSDDVFVPIPEEAHVHIIHEQVPIPKSQPKARTPKVTREFPKTKPQREKEVDEIPAMSISQSFPFDSTSDEENDIPNVPKEEPQPTVTISAHPEPIPKTVPTRRREYTPERWELETFEELKAFGVAIKDRMNERRNHLIRSVEDSITASCREITDYMEKCDSDLDHLRSDFMTQSVQFGKDITQKQTMVEELGLQQSEHIEQMVHDCDVIQKRAQDQIQRLAQQVKTMLANQEKHIALFREDMQSEVKAAATHRKRETSKRMVQQLVTLLDEL